MSSWLGRVSWAISLATIAGNVSAVDIWVDSSSDGAASPTLCQLRDAIIAANTNTATDGCVAGSGADRIRFMDSVTYIILESDLPQITADLEIKGPGRDQLLIDGDDSHGILNSTSSGVGTFILRDLTLAQGSRDQGGCVRFAVDESMIIEDVKIEACSATQFGGGIFVFSDVSNPRFEFRRLLVQGNVAPSGAGVYLTSANQYEILIEDTMLLNNRATSATGSGGGLNIYGDVDAVVSRSSFVLNEAANSGSAIIVGNSNTTVWLGHSTITQNELGVGVNSDSGGALLVYGQLTLFNAVVAGNTEASALHNVRDIKLSADLGGSITSEGYNFIGSNEGSSSVFPAGTGLNGDQVGTHAAPIDPGLLALADNGGPYMTVMPNGTSPLVDKGSCPGQAADQRGYQDRLTELRIIDDLSIANSDDGCDIGAIEVKALSPEPLYADGFEEEA
jgi:hypothetical protein